MEKITGKVFAFMMVTMILFAGQLMADQVTEVCLCRKSPQGLSFIVVVDSISVHVQPTYMILKFKLNEKA